LNSSFDSIKGADPSVKVIVGGLDSGVDNYLDHLGAFRADAIATHPYGQWPGPQMPSEGGPWFNIIRFHIAQYQRHLGGRELWFTEWGTGEDITKARNITAFFQEPHIRASVAEAYFFGWSDLQELARGTFGITTDGQTRKDDAWNAFRDSQPDPGPSPPPPPASGTFGPLVVKFPVGEGVWVTQCAPDMKSQLVWKTSAAGPDSSSRFADAMYAQDVLESCGAPSTGAFPLLFTSLTSDQLQTTWVTQCAGSGTRHVFRVEGDLDGHPVAPYRYDEPADDCQ
jgi:hypothetical protein